METQKMKKDAVFSSRIDSYLKAEGDAILSSLGIKPSQALTMFYTQVVNHKGLPFDVKIPNEETIKALNEDISRSKRYTDLDKMFLDLES